MLRQNEEIAKQKRTDANSSPFPPSRAPNAAPAVPRRRMFPSYPNIIKGLIALGYSGPDIRKIMGLNLLRVLRQHEEGAKQK